MAAAKKKKSMKPGGGGRFAALEKKVEGEGKDSPSTTRKATRRFSGLAAKGPALAVRAAVVWALAGAGSPAAGFAGRGSC